MDFSSMILDYLVNDSYDRWQFFEFKRKIEISIIYIIIYIILIIIVKSIFKNCHLSFVIVEAPKQPHVKNG